MTEVKNELDQTGSVEGMGQAPTVKPTYRVLFNKKERFEVLTLDELHQVNIPLADIQRSRTTPVAHYELIEDLMRILTDAGQEPVLDHIYVTNQGGSTPLRNIEEQYGGIKNILPAWILKKITGKIFIPRLDDPEMKCCVAFAYHDKGIDVAFGHDVRDCSNMCIYGSNILHTWGKTQNVDYKRMLEIIADWSKNLDKMHERDLAIIKAMMTIKVTSDEMLRFIGKLLALANASNAGENVVAPLNVTQVSEMTRGLLNDEGIELFDSAEEVSLWRFFNAITFVMKVGSSDVTTLLTDVTEIGNMMIQEYAIQVPEEVEEEIKNPDKTYLHHDDIGPESNV